MPAAAHPDADRRNAREFRPAMRRGLARASRWTLLYVGVGLIAGAAAVLFYFLCQAGLRLFLDALAGFRPPASAGEAAIFTPGGGGLKRGVLLLLPAAGGLLCGWLTTRFAPEAAGGGNDAAIRAFHFEEGVVRGRVPLVKMLATTLTLTTGGSGGREGPIAQIGAGLGSWLAMRWRLSARDRRILMAAGIAAGVGSIFRAPLAGALLAAEFLYREPDFEYEVIIPAGMASVSAYCLFCMVYGWGSLLHAPDFLFRNPLELGPYLVLAVVVAGGGILFIKLFEGAGRLFRALSLPAFIKPAIGGLLTGLIGFFLPQTLSLGYGYAQQALDGRLPIAFLLALAFGKMVTTSLSIGSGGSGGVFGPSVVIGGALGGAVGQALHGLFPAAAAAPGAFVVVGMAGFFAAVSNAPIATILFVSEMTNSYHLLLPSLLVCSVATLATRRWTIFPSQVRRRIDSPAHAGDFFVDVLQEITVGDLMDRVRPATMIPEEMTFADFKKHFAASEQHYFPVKDAEGRLTRIFSVNDIRGVLFEPGIERLVVMKDIGTSAIITTNPREDLSAVLRKFTRRNIDSLPVVDSGDPRKLIGMLSRRDVIACYNRRLEALRAASA